MIQDGLLFRDMIININMIFISYSTIIHIYIIFISLFPITFLISGIAKLNSSFPLISTQYTNNFVFPDPPIHQDK